MKFRLFISSILVMLFADRLEIWTAGSLPRGWTVDMLLKPHTSLPPNELIAGPMYLKGYIERLGTGTEDVAKLCAKSGLPAPGFTEGVDFRAVLKRSKIGADGTGMTTKIATEVTTVGGTLNGTLNGRLNPTAAKVLSYIGERPGCRALAIIADLSIPRDTLNKIVKRLSTQGFIERRGGKKTGGYFVVEPRPFAQSPIVSGEQT